MTLGDCVREYRTEHSLSQRKFADMCGLSNAYISVLEKNVNPKTKEAPAPTVGVYKKIANAMGISAQELMEKAEDSSVSLGSKMTIEIPAMPSHQDLIDPLSKAIETQQNTLEIELLTLFHSMEDTDKEKFLDYGRYIVDSKRRQP